MGKFKNNTFHGLTMRTFTSLDAAWKELGMDFEVGTTPLEYTVRLKNEAGNYEDQTFTSPREVQVYRKDDGRAMGVVGLVYRTMSHPVALEFARQLIAGGARIIGGGCPNRGERAYLILESDGNVAIGKNDNIVNRFVLTNTHDGTGKIELRITPFWSRAGTAFNPESGKPLSFKHTTNVQNRLASANKVMARVNRNWDEFSSAVQKMIAMPLNEREAKDFIEAILPHTGDEASPKLENIRSEILTIFRDTGIGCRLPACRGTVFGILQAFSEYADIKQTVRKSDKRDRASATLDARLIGDAAKKKAKAYGFALWMTKQTHMKGANS